MRKCGYVLIKHFFQEIRRWKETDDQEEFTSPAVAEHSNPSGTDWATLPLNVQPMMMPQQQQQITQQQSTEMSNGTGWGDSMSNAGEMGNNRWGMSTES